MLRCNLEEREDAAMARFFTGLNREIQDILEYKDYANINRLVHFACKAERDVQGRHASAKTNFSAGRTNSWQPQIQHLGCPQQQRVPHYPPSLLNLQAERETSNVTAAKGLDTLCVIAPLSVFWS
jgi:hypothetical protein